MISKWKTCDWLMSPLLSMFFVDDFTVLARQSQELSPDPAHPDPPLKLQLKRCSLGRARIFKVTPSFFYSWH